MVGGTEPPGLETVRVSVLQSPIVILSADAAVPPLGGDRTIVSKSILSLQTSVFVLQKV